MICWSHKPRDSQQTASDVISKLEACDQKPCRVCSLHASGAGVDVHLLLHLFLDLTKLPLLQDIPKANAYSRIRTYTSQKLPNTTSTIYRLKHCV
jgi:hypothetical protein